MDDIITRPFESMDDKDLVKLTKSCALVRIDLERSLRKIEAAETACKRTMIFRKHKIARGTVLRVGDPRKSFRCIVFSVTPSMSEMDDYKFLKVRKFKKDGDLALGYVTVGDWECVSVVGQMPDHPDLPQELTIKESE